MNLSHIKTCELYPGSIFEVLEKYKAKIDEGDIRSKIQQYEKCDDLTKAEKEFLAALKKVLE